MASIVKNVVHWGSSHRTSSPPVQLDLCEVSSQQIIPVPRSTQVRSKICGKKPKFVDKGFKHPYCSRSCARNGQGPSPTGCVLHGCRATGKPAFSNFCSESHAKEGVRLGQVEGCQKCAIQPRTVGPLCIPCDRRESVGPRLRELNADGSTFKSLRAQFLSEWESSEGSPSFAKAYEIILPRDVRIRHDQYRSSNPKFEEVRSFHSSQCICDLGFKDSALCSFKSCGICCPIKSSFKSFAFGAPANKGRFGDGIYSYRNPALADRFATSCTSSPYRVVIACDATVEPMLDEIADEESLFVPSADAILPVFVIMYTR
ncbi:uncharacterized protein LACBIDRAFT_318003 [Laccaria bicolor S238N-H82]|uniref:Predicted protein n=1 Tax=Laccaria bicolor (strain S238N-H82 / ATCC MYA-4686) TaxID=486041 RepID=B0D5Q7_LACBS|nr:uncharacterized protein LACBIDRAFT_318003 [Laccaria bicolor S238N-H82]EDR09814.1 predicted protein [Laccaria bicolor S238N-H82]|eukprot:XP_001879199.1 predicted protein [Laccaria bicolor S238N-H82]